MEKTEKFTAVGAISGGGAGLLGNSILKEPSGYAELAAKLKEQALAASTPDGWALKRKSLVNSGALGRAMAKLGPRGFRGAMRLGRFTPATILPVVGGLLGAGVANKLSGNGADRNSLRT